jgi:hypothetical protein
VALLVCCFFQRVFYPADRVLHFSGGLFRFAFGFELGVARHLACGFLQSALRLVSGTFDSIFVHCVLLFFTEKTKSAPEEFLCPPADAAKFARAWNRAGRVPLIINRREIASAREQLVRGEFSHQSK